MDTHNALGLLGAAVVDDCSLSDDPYMATSFGQESILTGHHLTLGNYCKIGNKQY